MRRLKVIGLCLGAMLAITAIVATTSAEALPEFGKCEVQAKHEGKYANNNCTTVAKVVSKKPTGEFEWTPMAKVHNSDTERVFDNFGTASEHEPSTLSSTFLVCSPGEEHLSKCRAGESTEAVGPIQIECTEDRTNGSYPETTSKEVRNVIVHYSGCKGLGIPCGNTAFEGEIETNPLKGSLGYLNKSKKEVGIDIKPQSGKEFAKFQCGDQLSIIVGEATEKEGPAYPTKGGGDGVIGVITPVNAMVAHITSAFTSNEETSENLPNKLEGKPIQLLEDWYNNLSHPGKGSLWSKAGQTQSDELGGTCLKEAECLAEVKA